VENYWSPGPSGYGAHVPLAGVQNFIVRGATPVRGIVDLSMSNHVYVMRWYYETVRRPSMACGFQNSVLLGACGVPAGKPTLAAGESASSGPPLGPMQRPAATAQFVARASAGSRKR
jgi:hypothetical protein